LYAHVRVGHRDADCADGFRCAHARKGRVGTHHRRRELPREGIAMDRRRHVMNEGDVDPVESEVFKAVVD